MFPVLLGSVLSLVFFSAVLAGELRGGDPRRLRELGVMVGILLLVAAYASHAVIAGTGAETAGLASLLLPGG
jgi:hypothetical protein